MNHPLFKQIKKSVIVMIVSIVIPIVDILVPDSFSFGKLINMIYPCKQDPLQPLFCYVFYDFGLFIVMAGIFVISLLTIIWKAIYFLRGKKYE